jgi:hypothetical protein
VNELATVAVTCALAGVGGARSEVGGRLGARPVDGPADRPAVRHSGGCRRERPLTTETRVSGPAGRLWTFRTIGPGGPDPPPARPADRVGQRSARSRPNCRAGGVAGRGWWRAGRVLEPARPGAAHPHGTRGNRHGARAGSCASVTIRPPSPACCGRAHACLTGNLRRGGRLGTPALPVDARHAPSGRGADAAGQAGARPAHWHPHRAAHRPVELACCDGGARRCAGAAARCERPHRSSERHSARQ